MNIFATGMNPVDANALKRSPRVAIFQAFSSSMQYLQDLGENVTWRRSRVGEPLPPGTDAVIVSSMLPRSLNCPYALGVIWTISEASRQEIPLVIYLTDWAFFKAHSEFRSIAKAGAPYFYKRIGGALQYNEPVLEVMEHEEELLEVCRQYGDPSSKLWRNAQVMVPRYTHWGDVKIIQRMLPGAHQVFTLDPTPLFLQYLDGDDPFRLKYSTLNMPQRELRWIFPSLVKDNTWVYKQNLAWPVDRFGPKGFPVLNTERDVHMEYRRRAGALCPPYPTAGSGWWRSRWIHAARAGSVLLCDSRDGAELGTPYSFNGPYYETLDTISLERAARDQRERIDLFLQRDFQVFESQLYAPFLEAGVR